MAGNKKWKLPRKKNMQQKTTAATLAIQTIQDNILQPSLPPCAPPTLSKSHSSTLWCRQMIGNLRYCTCQRLAARGVGRKAGVASATASGACLLMLPPACPAPHSSRTAGRHNTPVRLGLLHNHPCVQEYDSGRHYAATQRCAHSLQSSCHCMQISD